MNTADPKAAHPGRRQLLLLAALFLVPLALAFALYYGPFDWRPSGSTSQGLLIDPPRPLPYINLAIAGGSPIHGDLLRGKWSLVYIGEGYCDERCRRALYLTRQTRTALNKDAGRVERVFLATGPCCDDTFIEREHPDLVIALPNGVEAQRFLDLFPGYADDPTGGGRIYIVDPLGNLVMSYPADAPDKAMLKDLTRLLRLSHIG
jgi:hypothetical protein